MHCHGLLDIFIFETIEHNKMKNKKKYATLSEQFYNPIEKSQKGVK
jgi:hypothetical protein